jgi:hypothetical protein
VSLRNKVSFTRGDTGSVHYAKAYYCDHFLQAKIMQDHPK